MRQFLAVFASLLVGGGAALAQTVDPSGAGPCGGQSTYNYNGAVYRLAEIGDQCWFADNLRSASFQNGDPITYANNGGAWTSFGSPRRGVRDNNDALAAQQGYFYNFPAITDARGLCPAQYRVPTTTDFNNMVAQVIQLYGSNDNALFRAPGTLGNGGFWNGDAFVSGSNLSGFTGQPWGWRSNSGNDDALYTATSFWTSSTNSNNQPIRWVLGYNDLAPFSPLGASSAFGGFVRCLKDNDFGCTDPGACNFSPTAQTDDGTCCSLKTKVGVTAMAAPSPREPATVTARRSPKENAIVRAMWRTLVACVEVTVQVVKDAPIRPLATLTPQL